MKNEEMEEQAFYADRQVKLLPAPVPDINAPPAGNPDMDAELGALELEGSVKGIDMSVDEFNATCQALDDLCPQEVTRYVETFARLLRAASPGPWRLGSSGGSVVNDDATACPPDVVRFYGGNCIFESARLADRELLVFMRNIAPSLLRDLHYAETLDSINDGLLKACGQLHAENKSLQERIKTLMDQKIQISP